MKISNGDDRSVPSLMQDTAPRIPLLAPEAMNPAQRKVYDAVVSGPRGAMVGPLRAAIHSPELAEKWQQFGAVLRYQTTLGARLNELAILITARHFDAQFEWHVHVQAARKAGLPEPIIEALRLAQRPPDMNDDESMIYDYCDQLHRTHFVSGDCHRRVQQRFGTVGVVELTALVGYYAMVAMTLNAHQLPLPEGVSPPMPTRQALLAQGNQAGNPASNPAGNTAGK